MADNISVTAGTGPTVAADDVGGVLYQRVKVAAGADGAATDVSAAAPLPVTDAAGATAANQTTIIGHVDGIEGLLTTIDADTSTLAAAVAGTEVQVDVLTLPALPAGTNNIGDVDVATVALPTAIYHGQTTVTTAGTEVALAASQAILSGVTIKALASNTGIMYIGANPVTSSTGFALAAGEQIFIEISNLATVYVDASVNGEKVSYIAT